MADESRPRPPILKRFANLDIDGVELERKKPEKRSKPPAEAAPTVVSRGAPTPPRALREATPSELPSQLRRPAPPSPSRPISREQVPGRDDWRGQGLDLQALERLGAELNDNARTSRQSATPEARRAQRAAELRASRPLDPRPSRPLTPAEVRERQAAQVRREVDRIRFDLRQVSAEELEIELPPELRSGGVRTVETRSAERRGLDMRFETRPMPSRSNPRGAMAQGPDEPDEDVPLWELPRTAPPPPWSQSRTPPRTSPGVNAFTEQSGGSRPRALAAPNLVELTPMAARQIQLMAWEAGVPGSPLRILTSHTPGLGHPEIDFAFDEEITPEDTVVDALGVTVVIDPRSLAWVRGRRITWHDVPGSEGFLVR
jgi:Fe-S cluster assembly iron-binding protein IscA